MLSREVGEDGLQVETLPPFLRVLLSTDGTVTRSLEAYFGQPIDVEVIVHERVGSEQGYPQIGIERGQAVVLRRVVLRGRIDRVPYAFAQSVIAEDRITPEMRTRLIVGREGIGEVLIRAKQRTFREILSVRRAEAREWGPLLEIESNACVLVRQYTICHDLSPSILIEEVFPKCRYDQDGTNDRRRG